MRKNKRGTGCINKRIISLSILFFTWLDITAQSFISQFEIENFTKQQYGAGAQNWKIKQDRQGRIYFANNEGVLVYDGTYWKLYPLPNKTIVRSIEFGKDFKLYAGGQDEIGYYAPDKTGNLAYTSLKSMLPESERSFSDVWDIVCYGNDVFFRTTYKIFRYSQYRITIHPPISTWLFLGEHQGQLIAHDERAGILIYSNNGVWSPLIERSQLPDGFFITSICPFGKDSSLITTAKNGLFILSGKSLTPFVITGNRKTQSQNLSVASRFDEDDFLVSTFNDGIYRINKSGRLKERYAKAEGLQNSNIRSMLLDKDKNIWLGLDNGISFIAYNSAIKHVNPQQFNDAAGYSIAVFEGDLYFALANGIYYTPLNQESRDISFTPNNVTLLAGGQSWKLTVIDNKLYAARDDGFFMINHKTLIPVSNETGYWIFKPYHTPSAGSFIAAGNYNGVKLFEQDKNGVPGRAIFSNEAGSARFLAIEHDTLWVSHPYRGVYKIIPATGGVKLYTDKDGLPSALNNHIYTLKDKVLVATEKGIYEYDYKKDFFIPSSYYKTIFGETSVRYLKEDTKGNIWFVHDKSLGVVDMSTEKPRVTYLPELEGRILSGFENIYAADENNIFTAGENGFYHINYTKYKANIHSFKTYIRSVRAIAKKDSLIYGGYPSVLAPGDDNNSLPAPQLGYSWNSFHFEYSSSLYGQDANLQYSYYLKGFDDDWAEWTPKTEKDYTKLPPGRYTFLVKARNNLNNETAESSFSFTVLPPWYLSIWAKSVYFILLLFAAYGLYKWQERRHARMQENKFLEEKKKLEEEQKRMTYQHQLQIEKSAKDLIQLQNEKLENEIEHKNTQLASTAMNLVQKKEFILKIKEELQHLLRGGRQKIETTDLKKIFRILSDEENLDEEWEQFSMHFDNVHGDFLVLLKEKFPELKPHELKLCAYLRMNLSSKEIAQLMGISVRGVEISRYRLRKKLQIPTETNLFQFLFDLQSENK